MIQPFLSSWKPKRSGPLTRTSPGSAKAGGAVGSRAHRTTSDNDTNASFRTESQSFLTTVRPYLEELVPPSKTGPRNAEVEFVLPICRASSSRVTPRNDDAAYGRNAQIAADLPLNFHPTALGTGQIDRSRPSAIGSGLLSFSHGGVQRHFILVIVLLWAQPQPR